MTGVILLIIMIALVFGSEAAQWVLLALGAYVVLGIIIVAIGTFIAEMFE